MIRLLWRTDVHLSDVAPVSRKDDWAETVFGKLTQIGLVARKLQVDAVLDGGDFFHVKSPGRNSHALVRRVADLHKTYPCPTYGNVGNHDCVYGDMSYLDQQPLGVLFSAGVFQRCYDNHEAVFERDGLKVRVVGVPYHGTSYDMERFRSIQRKDEDFLLCMAHVLASPTGGTMFEGEDIVKYSDLEGLAPDLYMFGHWHKDQGVTDLGFRQQVINIGSLTRGSLSQDDLERKPGVALIELVKGQRPVIKVLRLRTAPSDEVFDLEAKVRAEKRTTTVDTFVESIKTKLILSQGDSIEDTVKSLPGVPDKVRERVISYLEKADQR